MPSTSFSEVSSFLSCRRKHWYGYSRSLERIDTSDSLSEGTLVHAVLESFYRSILAGNDFETSLMAAKQTFEASDYAWDPSGKRADMGVMLFEFYFPNEPFVKNGWTVLAVEKEFTLEWDSDAEHRFSFVIDLILRDPYGAIVVVDHKTATQFKDADAAALEPQVPLYIAALRALGYPADYGIYNQIRTLKIVGKKTPLKPKGEGPTLDQAMTWTRIPVDHSRLVTSFREQTDVSLEIDDRRKLPLEVLERRSFRVANKMVCNSCAFKQLCIADLNGQNTDLIERTYYKARTRKVWSFEEETA